MSELQATLEFCLELHKFYNVDLFLRGFYQIQVALRVNTKLPSRVEINLNNKKSSKPTVHNPATCPIKSKSFRILFRNEEIDINEIILFRVHLIIDSFSKLSELANVEYVIDLRLCFNDGVVSSRSLTLNISSGGIHYYRPVFFDYFHLCAVSFSLHGGLIAVHIIDPEINFLRKFPKQTKGSLSRSPDVISPLVLPMHHQSPMISPITSCVGTPTKLSQAKATHEAIMSLLIESNLNLKSKLIEFLQIMNKFDLIDSFKSNNNNKQNNFDDHFRTDSKIKKAEELLSWPNGKAMLATTTTMSSIHHHHQQQTPTPAKTNGTIPLQSEDLDTEDFLIQAHKDISQLCAENILVWHRFLDLVIGKEPIRVYLSNLHHTMRTKRFSEGFYVTENPLRAAFTAKDYTPIVELLKKSINYTPLPIECIEIDGDINTIPVVFEDQFIGGGSSSSSHSVSAASALSATSASNCSLPLKQVPLTSTECSCGIADILNARSSTNISTSNLSTLSAMSSQPLKSKTNQSGKTNKPPCHSKSLDILKATSELPRLKIPSATSSPREKAGNSPPVQINGKLTLYKEVNERPATADNSDDIAAAEFLRVAMQCTLLSHHQQGGFDQGLPGHLPVSTLPRRHSSSVRKLANSGLAIRKYSSTPLLNEMKDNSMSIENEVTTSEESGWVGSGSNSRRSSDDISSSDEINNVASRSPPLETQQPTTPQPPPTETTASDVVDPEKIMLVTEIPPPAEFQDLSPNTSSDNNTKSFRNLNKIKPPEEFRDPAPCSHQSLKEIMDNVPPVLLPLPLPPPSPDVIKPKFSSLQYKRYSSVESGQQCHTSTGTRGSSDLRSSTSGFSSDTNGRRSSADNCCNCMVQSHQHVSAQLQIQQTQQTTKKIHSNLLGVGGMSTIPYFIIPDELRIFHPKGLHLIICVHGLDGSCHDLRLFKIYLEVSLPGQNVHFLMSEKNQDGLTFSDFESMTDKFVSEILSHIEMNKLQPNRISFVGHSLGNIIIRSALTRPQMAHLIPKLHTFLSLSGPHLGTLYNGGLVNMGMWLMQKWKKSSSLLQLSLKDHSDIRQTFIYKLSEKSNLHKFKNVLLCGSSQDRYVPIHSAHILNCKGSLKDSTQLGEAYREMVMNILNPILTNNVKLIRYDVHHALASHSANSIIGRAAHIAVLDSEIFIEKFLSVSAVKYFQ